jgi:uncharacterized protein YbbC (DUF1343 family)
VQTGIEVLKSQDFAPLKGKRIGLITNFTAVLPDYTRTLDVLAKAPGVTVVAVFTPEHGLTATLAQANIESGKDEATGLSVYSLYQRGTYRPTAEMMRGIDALVYDIRTLARASTPTSLRSATWWKRPRNTRCPSTCWTGRTP